MKVFLIGAGPGDPGLLTIKGRDALAAADVVVYDALANDSLLSYARPDAEKIYVGKVAGNHALPQDQINALLVSKAKEGNVVARLKGGDPYIFGRGGEEGEELAAAGIPFEEVPGISSTIAAPAYAGIPVTHRDFASSVTIITGHENPDKPGSVHNWEALAASASTLEAAVLAKGPMRDIMDFMTQPNTDTAAAAAKVLNSGAMKPLEAGGLKAFITTFRSGHTAIVQRRGAERLPVKKLLSPAVPHMMGNEEVRAEAEALAYETLQREIGKRIEQLTGARA